MLSQGIPLMHAGEEMLRTKEDENGEYVSDSVRSSDYVNSIKWDNLKKKLCLMYLLGKEPFFCLAQEFYLCYILYVCWNINQ